MCILAFSSVPATDHLTPLLLVPFHQLSPIPHISSIPTTFILLEMILRSTSSDAQLRLQAMHTLSILTAPDRCRAVLAAPSMAVTLPLFGAVVSSSKALRAEGWKLESLGVAMKLLTVIASNIFKMAGELSNFMGTVLTASVIQQQQEEGNEQKRQLQQQGQQEEQEQQQGRQQEQNQQQQKQEGTEQAERKRQQEELVHIAQLSHQAQFDGLMWVGWHCLLSVGNTTSMLTRLMSCIWGKKCMGCAGGERQGRGGEVAAGAGGDHTAGGERQGLGGEVAAGAGEDYTAAGQWEGKEACKELSAPAIAAMKAHTRESGVTQCKATAAALTAAITPPPSVAAAPTFDYRAIEAGVAQGKGVPARTAEAAVKPAVVTAESSAAEAGVPGATATVGSKAPPALAALGEGLGEGLPTVMDEGVHTVPKSATIMERCLSLLEDPLYAKGLAGVTEALAEADADSGKAYRLRPECLFWLLQELSSSDSAAGAGAALREDGAAHARWEGAETAAGSAASPGTSATSAASARTAVGAAAGALAAAVPLVLCPAVPSVLGDILAAAALGSDTEVNLPEGRIEDGSESCEHLRAQIVEARCALVACLEFWGGRAQEVGSTATAVEDTALELLSLSGILALRGLMRPVGFCCNEAKCGNLEGLSEVGLVVPGVQGAPRREEAGVCGRCKTACYCSRVCQRHHMKVHCDLCGPSLKQQQQQEEKAEEDEAAAAGTGAAGAGVIA
jgi:hypothetical protein